MKPISSKETPKSNSVHIQSLEKSRKYALNLLQTKPNTRTKLDLLVNNKSVKLVRSLSISSSLAELPLQVLQNVSNGAHTIVNAATDSLFLDEQEPNSSRYRRRSLSLH